MKKKYLSKAITLCLVLGTFAGVSMPDVAMAEAELEPTRANVPITYDGKTFVNINFYENGIYDKGDLRSLKTWELSAITDGLHYWYDVLGAPTSGVPVINFYPQTGEDFNDNNASANSSISNISGNNNSTRLSTYFISSLTTDTENPSAVITVDDDDTSLGGSPWYYANMPIIPANGTASDYPGTITHEMFHALGVAAYAVEENQANVDEDGNILVLDVPVNRKETISEFAAHLQDSYGNLLKDATYITLLSNGNEGKRSSGNFYVKAQDSNGADTRYGGVYFIGDNVTKVLNGAVLDYPDGTKINTTVSGIPVNSVQGDAKDGYELDLSHFELQNSLQSHQNYRNWCVPMEVELAAMQDIGYTLDRSKFYGSSIYASGTETNKNNVTISNDVTHKTSDSSWYIGLHVYGSYNSINQNANITAHDGTIGEVLGIRVDGVGNDLTIASGKTISVDGKYARGIAFAYGKDHTLTLNGTVNASGANNEALSFDFGDNELGNFFEYRGSYIRTEGKNDDDSLKNSDLPDALSGPLMKEVNINGTINATDGADAIFISQNALVKNINVNKGAKITGNIIDNWNKDASFVQLPDDEDGMTSLNLDSGITYNGNVVVSGNSLNVYDTHTTNDKSSITVGSVSGGGVLNVDLALIRNNNVNITLNTVDNSTVAMFLADKDRTPAGMQGLEDEKDKVNEISTSTFVNGGNIYVPDSILSGPVIRDANGTHIEKGTNDNISEALSPSADMSRFEMNDIRKRMGDIRVDENNSGVWLRNENGALIAAGIDSNFHKWQLGFDKKLSDKWHLGAAYTTTSSGTSFATGYNKGTGNSGAIYGMYTARNGSFADIIARYGNYDNELSFAPGGYLPQHGTFSQSSFSLSGEIGRTIKLEDDLFLEPQLELSYTKSSGDNFTSNTVLYDLDGSTSLVGRLGATFGYHAGRDTLYTRLSFLHEFSGDSSLNTTFNGTSSRTTYRGSDSWVEWAIGGQYNFSKASYVYADIERTFGANIEEDYRLNLGFRYNF